MREEDTELNTQRAGVDVGPEMSETQEGISQAGFPPLASTGGSARGNAPPDTHLDPRCKGHS